MKYSLRDMSGMIRAAPDVAEESINHMIFTCPPATQCWALSTIPLTSSGLDTKHRKLQFPVQYNIYVLPAVI